jgi:hypothetical protein
MSMFSPWANPPIVVEVGMVVVAIFALLVALNPKVKVFSVLGLVIVIF